MMKSGCINGCLGIHHVPRTTSWFVRCRYKQKEAIDNSAGSKGTVVVEC